MNLQNKSQHKNNKCFSWVPAVRVLPLAGSHCPPHLPRMPSNAVLISGSAMGAAQIPILSYSSVFLPLMSTAIRTTVFSFVGTLYDLFIFHWHRICLVDCVDLIRSLYSWWEGFWVFFLSHTAPGFQLWFYFHLCMRVIHWGLLLRLPWRTWVWRCCSCLGRRGSGSTRYSGELVARAAGNTVL